MRGAFIHKESRRIANRVFVVAHIASLLGQKLLFSLIMNVFETVDRLQSPLTWSPGGTCVLAGQLFNDYLLFLSHL